MVPISLLILVIVVFTVCVCVRVRMVCTHVCDCILMEVNLAESN